MECLLLTSLLDTSAPDAAGDYCLLSCPRAESVESARGHLRYQERVLACKKKRVQGDSKKSCTPARSDRLAGDAGIKAPDEGRKGRV